MRPNEQQRPDQTRAQAIEDIYPLSGMQQGMLYHSLREPDSGIYYSQLMFELEGPLDVEAFSQAWRQVQNRHAVLRSTFLWQGVPQMLQVVHRQQELPFGCRDWRDRGAEQQRRDLESYQVSCRSAGFDLETGPLWGVELIRVADTSWRCVFSSHHALWDGWSMPVVIQEVLRGYQAALTGRRLSLPPARPYRDYIAWLRQQDHKAAEAFWREQLSGLSAATPLGVERVLGDLEPGPEEIDLPLDAVGSDRLRQFVRHYRLTLNTLLQGAWALLLSRYSGQEDVVFGATTSGRPPELEGVERMVGLFINTLPVRVRVSEDNRVEDWLAQLQEQQLAARQFEYCSLVDLQGWSEVPAGSPLFESLLVFENYPVSDEMRRSHWGELRVGAVESYEQTNYPLTVAVIPGAEVVVLKFQYDRSRFERETIERLASHLQMLLEGIVASPVSRLSQLPMLTDGERQQLLVEWNDTAADYPKDRCIHQLFEAQAARTPEATAAVFEDQQLTYAELNTRVNQLAHHLRERGVGPDVLVGVCVERSLDIVVGLLGVLKAGGAYVPLDPDNPAERLAFMLEDTQAPVLLTQQTVLERLPANNAQVIRLDVDWNQIEQQPDDNPPPQANAENLAYVIYTSGSTGQPKGVMISHGSLAGHCLDMIERYELVHDDHVLQFSSHSFDPSVEQIFTALLTGASLVLRPKELWPAENFWDVIRRLGLSVVDLPPAFFESWMRADMEPSELASTRLRLVIVGGDVLTPELLQLWHDIVKNDAFRLLNAYGPTEATITSTLYEPLIGQSHRLGWSVPIGRPVKNTQTYILVADRRPAPIGVAGELCIGGAGLARGYLNRPDLTAEKFIPNPFSDDPNSRLYKTGDLCRWLPDGNLEFLGRLDHQVKVRGFRIELGEIEAALLSHEQVTEAAVLAREDQPGEKRLVAYVAPVADTTVSAADLREHLQAVLPPHMLPSAFVFLDSFPLTPNGKPNRKALPAPDGHLKLDDQYIPPRNPVEEQLCAIWQEVLRLDRVGVQDNFFHLGGHSLLATQVISRVRSAFQVELPVASLFTGPTVAEVGQTLQQQWSAGAGVRIPALTAQPRDEAPPLSFAQQRLWFLDQLLPDSPQYNMPDALRLRGGLDRAALERAFQQLVQRHEVLRTRFESIDGQPRQAIEADCGQPLMAYEDLRTLGAAEREREVLRRVQQEALRPFDLSRGPLLRVSLWQLADEEHVLLLNMHHIVSDGWSAGVLTSELSLLYGTFTQGKPDPLPPLSVQYADYAIWQRGWLSGDVLEGQLNFWREQLAGAEVLELPTDHPRPAISAGQGGLVDVQLSQSLSKELKQLCLEQEVSLFMLLLSAWQVLLSRYSGQEDIVVGAPIANRTHGETEGLIGFFINTLALRSDLSGDPQFSDLLGQVRERTLSAYAHQDLPFEQLVDALELERDLSRESLVQVMFAWQNAPHGELKLGELSLQPVPLEFSTAKFDLTLSMGESEAGLSGALGYRSDLFERETIQRMADHLRMLLEGIVSAPECRLSELPLLTDSERQQLLVEWNDTAADYPQDQCIHRLFETQAARTPEATAVVFEDHQLTYAELNARANQLAHHLRELGVGPEVLVGICTERSLEMVVGLLGVLKAGGAYVPLDPEYPAERLAFMLEDAQAPVLLTRRALSAEFETTPVHVVNLDAEWMQGESACIDNPNPLDLGSTPNHAAYVLYTSGSTGAPKGVVVEHRQVISYVSAVADEVGFRSGATYAMVQPLTVDSSVTTIYPPLFTGGCLHIISKELALSPEALSAYFVRWGIDCLKIAPSHLNALDPTRNSGVLPRERLIVGGEASRQEWAATIRSIARCAVFNHYGPTETTVGVLTCPVGEEDDPTRSGTVPIGRPLPNTEVYVLDDRLCPVPIGVEGELCIGGTLLTRGYLNQSELTAANFVPDPFSIQPGGRLYRTGDVVRWLANGNVEFIGRRDDQVKIRGFRIELGEIEASLAKHPLVTEVAVIAWAEGSTQRLVAYVGSDDPPSIESLLRHSRETLPSHMVPSEFIMLESLPRTAHGKLNRKALPAPDGHLELDDQYVPPRNPVEEQLCAIWQEVLRLDRVGVLDNFFHLGGDSILSIQVVARAGERGLRLTVRQVFEHQTIAALTEVAQQQVELQAEQGPVQGEAPLTPIQHRFFEQDLADAHHWNQALLLTPTQRLCAKTLQQAAQQLLQHHDALRMRFQRQAGGSWRQSFAAPEEVFLVERADLSQIEVSQQAEELEQQAGQIQARLNFEAGPLWRMTLFDLGADRPQRLLIAIHHLAVDGVSWRILLEDLGRLYAQAEAGESLSLPAKTTSLQQWAGRLQQYAHSDDLLAELDYWRDVVRTESQAFPVDDPRGDNTVGSAQAISVAFSQDQTEALLREVPAAYQTQINDVLLTALLQAYAAWSGQDSLVLELEGHGREELFADLDLSRTVGWFTTVYPLRLASPNVASAEVSLKSVKEQLRAIPQRGIGYGVLRYLSDHPQAGALQAAPDAALSFNYLGQLDNTAGDSGLLDMATESAGTSQSPRGQRRHLVEVNGLVSGGQLRMDWIYSEGIHQRATITALAEHFQAKLSALIEHCVSAEAGGYTPSDFPLSGLDQRQLDRLIPSEQARAQAIEDIYPLSGMQQGTLYHTLREPNSGIYYSQLVFELKGLLEVEAFGRAWQQVQSRHSVLRSTFLWQGVPQMLQVVHRRLELPLGRRDWREQDAEQQRQDLDEYLASCRSAGFDLEAGPLWGVELVRVADDSWWCVFSSHHALWDGWSMPVILQEVLQGYQAALTGQRLSLPPARPYRDYIAWLGQQDHKAAEAFWREQLSELTSATPLGVERVLGGVEPGPEEIDLPLDAELSDRLRQFVRRQRLTLNTLLQGAWALLLSRYSGQEDVIFGATTSGRPAELAGVEQMVGLFINTLPVRVRVDENDRVENWLSQLQERQLAARQFEHCSLVDLQSWSEVPAGSPLFESLLVFENYPVSDELRHSHWGELRVGGVAAHDQTNYPLMVAVTADTEVGLRFQYDRSHFERDTIERLAGHLRRLLEGIVSAPECRLSELPLLTDSERQQVLVEWNDTTADYPRGQCLHQLFEAQAARTPEAAAVSFEDQQLTYAELNAQANQLAHHLRDLGVGPEVMVGICVKRSLEMVVGVLGILKAGAAYVPLDPDYPAERLAFMLEDSQAPVLLTQQTLLERLPAHHAQVICLDADWQQIEQQPDDNPSPQANADNLAYVIYTSGSTGEPKGSLITHACVVRLLTATEAWFEFDEKDVWTLFHSFAFDFSVWELWGSLAYGGRLVVVPYWVSRTPDAFYKLLVEEGVTVLNQTPSAFWQLAHVDEGASAELSLRYVIFGGEALAVDGLRPWFDQHGDQMPELVNMYGITETTVHVTYRPLRQQDTVAQAGSPIGVSIRDLQLYVLDRQQNPTPVGVAGELYVRGAGLARGYLNRPELTAERFIPNPFSNAPGSRLYRTGDLCRWLPDGNIEFLGRLDQQVKIRGFRIELGEIESALLAHDQVREAVVLAREDQPGEKRLAAYVTLSPETTVSAADLRTHLQTRLPDYMLPATFVFLDAFPLTSNGKLDRQALPAPDGHLELEGQYVLPRNPVEEQLCGIWQEVLHVERVGAQDNFFDLGGHSLLATQVISRVRTAFQVELSVAALFTGPTVAELAQALQRQWSAGTAGVGVPPLVAQQRDEVVPLSFAQQRLWFLNQLLPDSPWYNMSGVLRLRGPLDRAALEQTLQQIVQRHEALRTRFESVQGVARQVVEAKWPDELVEYDNLQALPEPQREAAVRDRAQAEAVRPFDLSLGPMFRATLWQLGDEEHVLLLNMHHIVSDGWSMGVLIRELSLLYSAYCDGQPDPLPPLSVQYADYAIWQRGWLSEEILEHQLSYWREQLEGAKVLELPTDHPRPAVSAGQGGSVDVQLPKSLSEELKRLCLEQEVSLFMLLLSAWQVLLSRYTGQEDMVTGSPIANRTHGETEGLIGFFVNTLALRNDLSGDPKFSELLRQVRERMLAAYAHQDLPFEQLIDALDLERDLSRETLVQASFAWQNAPQAELELGELRWEPLSLEHTTAKFDLSLLMGDSEAGLSGSLEYRSDLFERKTIERIVGHLQRMLEGIVACPSSHLSDLPLLSDGERQQLLVEWNDTAADYPRDQCVHQLFEAQAQQAPEATAAVFEDQQLTYSQLNARANQLAHHLRQMGVGPEVLVGICVERSLEMLVGLLGILKAGGGYVPLDPTYPAERLAFMLKDTKAPVLLTQQALLERLPAHQAQVLCLDTDWNQIEQQPDANLHCISTIDNLAYAIYTSGSTGYPKGAMIRHGALLNHMQWMLAEFPVSAGDRILQKTPHSFDASVWEFYLPLLSGSTLVVARPGGHADPDYLVDTVIGHEITVLQVVPSLLKVLTETPRFADCKSLNYLFSGGEALGSELRREVLNRLPHVQLTNLYGPTECTIETVFYRCDPGNLESAVPIGRAVDNTQLFVVDSQFQPVPIGVSGELCIAGAQLSRGYYNRPELTAERFVPSPFSDAPGARLYRTGDLCRWLPDGNLEFIGRLDHQVKVRGYRIEVGEIESALLEHSQIHEAVVLAREDHPGDKRLVAYLVEESTESDDAKDFAGKQVSIWQQVHDDVFNEEDARQVESFSGWNSSYTESPIQLEEMQFWRSQAVSRILSTDAQRIWEIGCGAGLVLLEVAPHCSQYLGTDFSASALATLEAELDSRGLSQVTLERRLADDFAGIKPEQFDLVVINSVIQYFPNVDYLRRVLEGVVDSLTDGGALFVGDVRSLPLLEAFHTSVQMYQAPDDLPGDQLHQRVQRALQAEGELVVDPEYFRGLCQELPRLSHVEILLKRGRDDNELTRYRYDAFLYVGSAFETVEISQSIDWAGQRDLQVLEARLREAPATLEVLGIPNARVSADYRAWQGLGESPDIVGKLRDGINTAVDPEALWELGDRLGYAARVSWSRDHGPDCVDVLFELLADAELHRSWVPGSRPVEVSRSSQANNPLQAQQRRDLTAGLRDHLQACLPPYMAPSAFVFLASLPLTPNGKLDRKALPAPDIPVKSSDEYAPPRNPEEQQLCTIWQDVLGLNRVGVHDNFFHLGGHSLLAMQVISRVRGAFEVELPVSTLFTGPTVAQLAACLEQLTAVRGLTQSDVRDDIQYKKVTL